MTVEYIRYAIPNDRADEFNAAYQRAAESLATSRHCLGYEVARCDEDRTAHVVRIEWDSVEGHLEGFRKSREFRSFFEAVRPFVDQIEEMRHYSVLSAKGGRSG